MSYDRLIDPSDDMGGVRQAFLSVSAGSDHTVVLPDLADDGYEVVEVVGADLIDRLQSVYDSLDISTESSYFSSNVHCSPDAAGAVDRLLRNLLRSEGRRLLGDVEPFLGALIVKGAGGGGSVELHQDWSYTNERTNRVAILWVPLTDVSLTRGAMMVVPGSHLWTEGIRSDVVEAPTADLQEHLSSLARLVPLRRGEGLLYDPALIHGSPPNLANRTRPVAAVAFAESGAPLVHGHADAHGVVKTYEVDAGFYSSGRFRRRPEGYPECKPWGPTVGAAGIRAALQGRMEAPPRHPVPESSIWDCRRVPRLTPNSLGRVMPEDRSDHLLRRDGFVKLPLLSREHAKRLREGFRLAYGWEGDGFHADLNVASTPYRRTVDAMMRLELDDAVMSLFRCHKPFLRNYLCKWPGTESDLYLHQDWTYVDERQGHSSYVVWVALQDIEEHNGQLRVLRGSHLVDRGLRGTDLSADWLLYEDAIRSRLESVPVKAGECVVFNNALVHCSYPNLTSEPRVVAAIGMRPASAQLTYFRRKTGDSVERFDVNEDFYATITPAQLHASPPSQEVAEHIQTIPRPMSESEMLRSLGRGGLWRRAASRLGALNSPRRSHS